MNQENYELTILEQAFNNLSWLKDNFKIVQDKFEGKFIAIKDGHIIDSAQNKETLFNKLEKNGVDISTVLIEYIRPKGIITIL
ncbi:MAG: DUF5678 domain-containing protein [Nanoarchaeota archaeon]